MGKHTVFVIDDDIDLIDVVSDVLTDEGYTVRGETDAERAMETLARGWSPDLVLLDVVMPRMEPILFMDRLRRRCAHAPVLLFSAAPEVDDVMPYASGHLRKPCNLGALLAAVAHALRAREAAPPPRILAGPRATTIWGAGLRAPARSPAA